MPAQYYWIDPQTGNIAMGPAPPITAQAHTYIPGWNTPSAIGDEDMSKLVNKFEVGCDPEFCILDSAGKLIMCSALGKDGPVGYDHSGRVAEVHPDKAKGTWTLVKRIAEIINACPKLADYRYSTTRWRSGGVVKYGQCNCGEESCQNKSVSLGGHVHFNITPGAWKPEYTEALNKLSTYLEKLDILPETECQARRKHKLWDNPVHCYGTPADAIRESNDHTHIEYRTFASWLYDPWIAFLCLTAAKLAVVAPDIAKEHLSTPPSKQSLVNFVDAFRNKDINADRLLEKFERSASWLKAKPDTDIKSVWEGL